MKEAEVSLRIALYYICNSITNKNVHVSIDGAHIKTKDTVHFDIWTFLKENGCQKIDANIHFILVHENGEIQYI